MGRHYSGDIEGKFWFGVQSSDDADFFGGMGAEPRELHYYFTEDDLPAIEEGIKECKAELGRHKAKLDAFFEPQTSYTDEQLSDYLGLPHDEYDKAARRVLEWYARLELGEKILACVKEKGECAFTAEL